MFVQPNKPARRKDTLMKIKPCFTGFATALFVASAVRIAYPSADFGMAAYSRGAKFVEYTASSNYTACQDVPAKSPDEARRIQFDSQDNLWTFGSNSVSLYEYLSSERYSHSEVFNFGGISGFDFDREGNVWVVAPITGRPAYPTQNIQELGHSANLFELMHDTDFTTRLDIEAPDGHPVDIAIDGSDNLWIPVQDGPYPNARQVLKFTHGQGYANPIAFRFDLWSNRLLASRTGPMFTFAQRGLVELVSHDATLEPQRTLPPAGGAITLDSKENLWGLQGNWQITSNEVVELISASNFKQQQTFMVPRRVFGLAISPLGDVWVTSPEHNAPYAVSWGHPSGFRPENMTRLEAGSGYSKESTAIVPGSPYAVTSDSTGNIWTVAPDPNAVMGADTSEIIELVAASGYSRQQVFNVPGQPYGIAIDKRGNVWLAGYYFPNYSSVIELAREKNYTIGRMLHLMPGQLALAFDPQGNLWATDFLNHQDNLIELAAPDYRPVRQATVDGHAFALAFDASGNLWVATAGCPRNRLVELLKASDYSKEVSFPIDGRPYGVAVDAKGNVWASVAEMPKSQVTELTASNRYAPSLHFEVPAGSAAIGVDHSENVWLQNYDYSELRPFSSLGY